ncbi:uncharacterized protein LOC117659477 [Pantherophis guttatus]|uniref:Uncharacterized protein LOC117659477 n=1 Tax=Pantherophis guttatus TaxID=94885 RepID=A0ABM3Z4T0_PANGU|nr:uncharacterized protein LOC117659477 [Pantherophis guttatus]
MAFLGVPLMLLLGALARIPGSEGGKETPAHFLHQYKCECHFLNGTQRVRYLDRLFYDRQETSYFDSDLGKFVAVTPLGKPDVDRLNRDERLLQYEKASVDRLCRHNYEILQGMPVVGRRAKPSVSISPTKMEPSSPNTILLCIATGFYPVEIEVQWLKNGRPEEEGVAFGEELQNGDWTYQLQVMLETQPQRGDVYTCKVGHASLEAPITVQWEPRSSSSARSKLWTGIMGAVIGVAFLAVGLFSYLKSKKATPIQPPAGRLGRCVMGGIVPKTEKSWAPVDNASPCKAAWENLEEAQPQRSQWQENYLEPPEEARPPVLSPEEEMLPTQSRTENQRLCSCWGLEKETLSSLGSFWALWELKGHLVRPSSPGFGGQSWGGQKEEDILLRSWHERPPRLQPPKTEGIPLPHFLRFSLCSELSPPSGEVKGGSARRPMTLQKGGFPLVLLLFEDTPSSEVRGKLLPPSRPSDSSSGAGSVFLPPLGRLWGASMAFPGVPLMLLLGALARIPGSEGGKETPAHFLAQWKAECHFLNGTQRVRFLESYFYDRQEIVRFDSDLGKFVAVTELGEAAVDRLNRDEQLLQVEKASVDHFCRYNYGIAQTAQVVGRRAKPTVSISPTKMEPSSPNTILLCTATGFYPVEIEVQWLKNGQPEEEGVAFGEELQSGDWTYQLQVMLETQPQRGDVYTCKVGHASLEAPITVQWEPRSSSSARSKLWTGIMGAVIGVAFLAVGLFSYLKSKKAIPIQPPAALMN